jgi:uncharacterized membrane protein
VFLCGLSPADAWPRVAYNVWMRRLLPAALTAAAATWVALLLISPWFPRELAVVYEFASRVCHQKPDRSFYLAGVQLPVCARCFGLYASGAIAAVGGWFSTRRRHRPLNARAARYVFAAAAAPTVITVVLEWLGLAHPTNVLRAVASLPLGAAAGWIFIRMLLFEARYQTAEA